MESKWNDYLDKSPEDALSFIYQNTKNRAEKIKKWYSDSIAKKRIASKSVTVSTLIFLGLGTTLPIFAGIQDDVHIRLLLTQIGVATLAFAGLLQIVDRVLGWSSGWLRYISTYIEMDKLMRHFDLDWESHIININKNEALTIDDVQLLFKVGQKLEDDLLKLQSDETNKWVLEFSNGLALLDGYIKSQRESNEKTYDAARSLIEAKEKQNNRVQLR